MTELKNTSVAIYVRVSTLDQAREGYSLAAQRKILTNWCKERGFVIFKVYEDAGISGKDMNHRPQLLEMLDDANQKLFNLILVWSLSRFTRSVADLYVTCSKLQKLNVNLVSFTESFDNTTIAGRAVMGVLGIFAQMEREMISERVKMALAERATQGKCTCRKTLGYDLINGRLVVNKPEADQVRYIYETYIKHRNFLEVARICNARGIRGKRGNILHASSVKVILTRPIYIGYFTFHDQIYRGPHESIIDQKTFNTVQNIIKKQSYRKRITLQ